MLQFVFKNRDITRKKLENIFIEKKIYSWPILFHYLKK